MFMCVGYSEVRSLAPGIGFSHVFLFFRSNVRMTMKYLVKFCEDGVLYYATPQRIMARKESSLFLEVGAEVLCRFTDGRWYNAKIHEVEGKC